jgi:hypothetical protein
VGPQLRRRRDDVEVAEQQEGITAGTIAAQSRRDRAAARHRLDDLGREAGIAQLVRDALRRPELAIGSVDRRRIHGRDPD